MARAPFWNGISIARVSCGTIAAWQSVWFGAIFAITPVGKAELVPERRGCLSNSVGATSTASSTAAIAAAMMASTRVRRPRRAPLSPGGGGSGLRASVRRGWEMVTGDE